MVSPAPSPEPHRTVRTRDRSRRSARSRSRCDWKSRPADRVRTALRPRCATPRISAVCARRRYNRAGPALSGSNVFALSSELGIVEMRAACRFARAHALDVPGVLPEKVPAQFFGAQRATFVEMMRDCDQFARQSGNPTLLFAAQLALRPCDLPHRVTHRAPARFQRRIEPHRPGIGGQRGSASSCDRARCPAAMRDRIPASARAGDRDTLRCLGVLEIARGDRSNVQRLGILWIAREQPLRLTRPPAKLPPCSMRCACFGV